MVELIDPDVQRNMWKDVYAVGSIESVDLSDEEMAYVRLFACRIASLVLRQVVEGSTLTSVGSSEGKILNQCPLDLLVDLIDRNKAEELSLLSLITG